MMGKGRVCAAIKKFIIPTHHILTVHKLTMKVDIIKTVRKYTAIQYIKIST